MGCVIPPFLHAVAGKGPFTVKRSESRTWSGWPRNYTLLAEGERFPLAGGSLAYLMNHYQRLVTDYLRRRR